MKIAAIVLTIIVVAGCSLLWPSVSALRNQETVQKKLVTEFFQVKTELDRLRGQSQNDPRVPALEARLGELGRQRSEVESEISALRSKVEEEKAAAASGAGVIVDGISGLLASPASSLPITGPAGLAVGGLILDALSKRRRRS